MYDVSETELWEYEIEGMIVTIRDEPKGKGRRRRSVTVRPASAQEQASANCAAVQAGNRRLLVLPPPKSRAPAERAASIDQQEGFGHDSATNGGLKYPKRSTMTDEAWHFHAAYSTFYQRRFGMPYLHRYERDQWGERVPAEVALVRKHLIRVYGLSTSIALAEYYIDHVNKANDRRVRLGGHTIRNFVATVPAIAGNPDAMEMVEQRAAHYASTAAQEEGRDV